MRLSGSGELLSVRSGGLARGRFPSDDVPSDGLPSGEHASGDGLPSGGLASGEFPSSKLLGLECCASDNRNCCWCSRFLIRKIFGIMIKCNARFAIPLALPSQQCGQARASQTAKLESRSRFAFNEKTSTLEPRLRRRGTCLQQEKCHFSKVLDNNRAQEEQDHLK